MHVAEDTKAEVINVGDIYMIISSEETFSVNSPTRIGRIIDQVVSDWV